MEGKKYSPKQEFCSSAVNFQSVQSFDEYQQTYPDTPSNKVDTARGKTLYSCPDNYQMGSIQDDHIYIATTDGQHDQIVKGEHVNEQGGLSGYFSDQATVDACKDGENLDNTKYNEMCQIAPYREYVIDGEGDATYKPHVDCFDIDRDALYENYGTRDFNAAVAKCEANNQFGAGGGNQGYNPYISEMIDNGSLVHNPENSYSDTDISRSENNNPNKLTNSVVPEDKVDKMYADSQTRSQDCVNNNTPHPSPEACQNGFEHNKEPIPTVTGNALPCNSEQENQGQGNTPMREEAKNADEITRSRTASDEQQQQSPIQKEAQNADELAKDNTEKKSDTLDNVANENGLATPENTKENAPKKEQGIEQ